MYVLSIINIINKIYDNEMFPKILGISVAVLICLFVITLIMGYHDARKEKRKNEEDELKDITFNIEPESPKVKEDVTFEIPVLTKNLEDFKNSIEEEIKKETDIEISQNVVTQQTDKARKILDINEIEEKKTTPLISRPTEHKTC